MTFFEAVDNLKAALAVFVKPVLDSVFIPILEKLKGVLRHLDR